jgi:hypothetical protein
MLALTFGLSTARRGERALATLGNADRQKAFGAEGHDQAFMMEMTMSDENKDVDTAS